MDKPMDRFNDKLEKTKEKRKQIKNKGNIFNI